MRTSNRLYLILMILPVLAVGCDDRPMPNNGFIEMGFGGKPASQPKKSNSGYDIQRKDGYPYQVPMGNQGMPPQNPGMQMPHNPQFRPEMMGGSPMMPAMGSPYPTTPMPQGMGGPMIPPQGGAFPTTPMPNLGMPNLGAPNQGMPPSATGNWVAFRDPRGRYQCQFPAGKMQSGSSTQTIKGKNYTSHLNGFEGAGRAFVVIVTEGVGDPKTREEINELELEFAALAVRSAKAHSVRSSRTLTVGDGLPATQVVFRSDTQTSSGKCQVFLVDGHCFQVVAMDLNGSQANVDKFLESVELLTADGSRRPAPVIDPSPRLPSNPFIREGQPKTPSNPPPKRTEEQEETRPTSEDGKIKLKDKNFPAIGSPMPEKSVGETPSDVPQPNFPNLPTIPKIKTPEKKEGSIPPAKDPNGNGKELFLPPIMPMGPMGPVGPTSAPNSPMAPGLPASR